MRFKKGFNEMASDIGKRKISEWDVSEIEETDMACVHGVPVVVSPLQKVGRMLLSGELMMARNWFVWSLLTLLCRVK